LHYKAFAEYKILIDDIMLNIDVYNPMLFNELKPDKRAIFDAYLKRFSSLQDFLGSKIFPMLLDIAGIVNSSMSEVLYHIEKEGIIDSIDKYIKLREIRDQLEHDYPKNLQEALDDLKFCIDNFYTIKNYYFNSINFANKYIK